MGNETKKQIKSYESTLFDVDMIINMRAGTYLMMWYDLC